MAVQLVTLDILVKEAHFDPPIARAIGAAIESEIHGSQLVTMPLLDSRFAQFESKLDVKLAQLESRLFWKFMGFGATSLGIAIALLQLFRS